MTDHQHAKLASYGATEVVLTAHADAIAGLPAAQRAADEFRDLLADLRDAARKQTDYAPRGEEKGAKREALADVAVPVAMSVAAWAEEQGDISLADQISFTRSDFVRGREQDALDRASIVFDTATANLAELDEYGVEEDVLAALDAHIDTFANALAQPRHAIAERRAQTERIERLFPQIDRLLTRRLDRLVEQLRGTTFYSEYQTARTIVDR